MTFDPLDAWALLFLDDDVPTPPRPLTGSRVLVGDCRDALRELPDRSVQTVVTSPPYFGLRDYGTGVWEGGDADCDHLPAAARRGVERRASTLEGGVAHLTAQEAGAYASRTCARCGAQRTDQQIGHEATPADFVAAMVEVFREVRRVLRDDGTVWLNLGDSYAASMKGVSNHGQGRSTIGYRANGSYSLGPDGSPYLNALSERQQTGHRINHGCKAKDLLGIPWAVAFALRDDGWWLRCDVIWSKPNPMPESVSDRPTRAHEYLFLLSKSSRYFYDADAVAEASLNAGAEVATHGNDGMDAGYDGHRTREGLRRGTVVGATRNRRSVWTIATQPYAGAHFATFPPKLIEPCVLAGSAPKCCGICGAPWRRHVERTGYPDPEYQGDDLALLRLSNQDADRRRHLSGARHRAFKAENPDRLVGWEPTCGHQDDSGRCVVLDPFAGSGTTGVVAGQLDRAFVGVELSPEYADMARARIVAEGRPGNRRHEPPAVIPGQLRFA